MSALVATKSHILGFENTTLSLYSIVLVLICALNVAFVSCLNLLALNEVRAVSWSGQWLLFLQWKRSPKTIPDPKTKYSRSSRVILPIKIWHSFVSPVMSVELKLKINTGNMNSEMFLWGNIWWHLVLNIHHLVVFYSIQVYLCRIFKTTKIK